MEQRKKIQNDKHKLTKRISKEKKPNNQNNNIANKNNKKISSYNKINKIPQDSVRKRKPNENIDKNKKSNVINNNNKNIKQRFQEYINEQNKKNINIKQKRFHNIDEAVILIQNCFRNYLNKIHNTNSEIMKTLRGIIRVMTLIIIPLGIILYIKQINIPNNKNTNTANNCFLVTIIPKPIICNVKTLSDKDKTS